jgi:flavin-binding protein dodecin
MTDRTYKLIELVGTSEKTYEEAIRNAVAKAGSSLSDLAWFEVIELRGGILKEGLEYQAKVKIAFKVH